MIELYINTKEVANFESSRYKNTFQKKRKFSRLYKIANLKKLISRRTNCISNKKQTLMPYNNFICKIYRGLRTHDLNSLDKYFIFLSNNQASTPKNAYNFFLLTLRFLFLDNGIIWNGIFQSIDHLFCDPYKLWTTLPLKH